MAKVCVGGGREGWQVQQKHKQRRCWQEGTCMVCVHAVGTAVCCCEKKPATQKANRGMLLVRRNVSGQHGMYVSRHGKMGAVLHACQWQAGRCGIQAKARHVTSFSRNVLGKVRQGLHGVLQAGRKKPKGGGSRREKSHGHRGEEGKNRSRIVKAVLLRSDTASTHLTTIHMVLDTGGLRSDILECLQPH